MRNLEGAAIPMQTVLSKVRFLTGNADVVSGSQGICARRPFDEKVLLFLNDVSRVIMKDVRSRQYSDVVTFAFWIRKSSTAILKEQYLKDDGRYRIGKGMVFHIAPSNVPVNFAYSLASGLLSGNANIVRVPSKEFEQVSIIVDAFERVLSEYGDMKPYITLVRYGRERDVNDLFSSIADMRVVWGGDDTIAQIRRSPLPPRSGEITFADRYSLAVIDSDCYMDMEDKERVAQDFYNDTYFSDQNACTSPRIVIWVGDRIEAAKQIFWEKEYELVKRRYELQPIQAVNKLTGMYLSAVNISGCKVEHYRDNRIIRIRVPKADAYMMDYKDNSGFFFEYDCKDILEIRELCNDKRCQTVGYIGDKALFLPLINSGIKGVDRIIPMGKTMDFDLIWDGYALIDQLTRIVNVG